MTSQSGGAKKFLYTGPKKDADEEEELPWNFKPKTTGKGNVTGGFGVDDVWSIKRNVNLKAGTKEPKPEPLTFSTNKSYYSRYGDGAKDKDEFGGSLGTGGSTNAGQTDTKTWGVSGQSRRPFSYSFGTEQSNDQPVSPRNTSISSTGTYPSNGNFSQATNSNFNAYPGKSVNSVSLNHFQDSGNNLLQDSGNNHSHDAGNNRFQVSGNNRFQDSGNNRFQDSGNNRLQDGGNSNILGSNKTSGTNLNSFGSVNFGNQGNGFDSSGSGNFSKQGRDRSNNSSSVYNRALINGAQSLNTSPKNLYSPSQPNTSQGRLFNSNVSGGGRASFDTGQSSQGPKSFW